jgi:Ca2+/Na+ antiporter
MNNIKLYIIIIYLLLSIIVVAISTQLNDNLKLNSSNIISIFSGIFCCVILILVLIDDIARIYGYTLILILVCCFVILITEYLKKYKKSTKNVFSNIKIFFDNKIKYNNYSQINNSENNTLQHNIKQSSIEQHELEKQYKKEYISYFNRSKTNIENKIINDFLQNNDKFKKMRQSIINEISEKYKNK